MVLSLLFGALQSLIIKCLLPGDEKNLFVNSLLYGALWPSIVYLWTRAQKELFISLICNPKNLYYFSSYLKPNKIVLSLLFGALGNTIVYFLIRSPKIIIIFHVWIPTNLYCFMPLTWSPKNLYCFVSFIWNLRTFIVLCLLSGAQRISLI